MNIKLLVPNYKSWTKHCPIHQVYFFVTIGSSNTLKHKKFNVPKGSKELFLGELNTGRWLTAMIFVLCLLLFFFRVVLCLLLTPVSKHEI